MISAVATGAMFITATFHWWWAAGISGLLMIGLILRWLWTGTAPIPEKDFKNVGLGVTLPIYRSGSASVGWWAMFITMLGDITAFIALVFGYFFYWTIHTDFPPTPSPGPGAFWPLTGGVLLLAAWGLTFLSHVANRRDRSGLFTLLITLAILLATAGGAALVMGPLRSQMDPTAHVYQAIVWVLVGWTALHVAVGAIMQGYCLARRFAGRMTSRYDADICNVLLYWHFLALTVVITVGVVAGFPLVS